MDTLGDQALARGAVASPLFLPETFQDPHPDESGGGNASLAGNRTPFLKRFWIKGNGESRGQTLGKTKADGFELVFVISGAMGIPECRLFFNTGKLRDAVWFGWFLFRHSYLPRCAS